MKILVTGATGFVGTKLCHKLFEENHELFILSRNPTKAKEHFSLPFTFVSFNDLSLELINSLDGVINLMGENISAKRWSEKQKEVLWSSRIDGTKNLVSLLNKRDKKLKFFIQASAIGYYPVNLIAKITETTPLGEGFLSKLCAAWEKEAQALNQTERIVITRIGVVLGSEGGALAKLLPLFKLGAGGPLGSGQMLMSWIHVADLVELFIQAVKNPQYEGVINATAPQVVSNKTFTKALASAVGMPALFPAPPFMLKLVFGEMSTIMLDGQHIECAQLKSLNHKFLFPEINSALKDIVNFRLSDKSGKKKLISST
jgi:uncharacterized protein